jgi:transcriptional regulator with XRE-family HTH domain
MEFDKKRFSDLLIKARGKRSLRNFATDAGVSASYFSRLASCLVDTAPSADILKKMADVARNEVSYVELMQAAGHLGEENGVAVEKEDKDVFDLIQYWKGRAIAAEEDLHILKVKLRQLLVE